MNTKLSVDEILAKNLTYAMSLRNARYTNANALGVACHISPNTIRNIIDPDRRSYKGKKGLGSPRLDLIATIADKLGWPVWQLLHPNIEQAMREIEMYKRIAADFKALQEASRTIAPNSDGPKIAVKKEQS